MSDVDVVVVAGAPGVGKSTLCRELQRRLHSPLIEFSSLRQPHLDAGWSNASREEEAMAFENLVFIVENYVRHGYRNVIVTDLRDHRVVQVPQTWGELSVRIVSLVLRDDDELRRRIAARPDGFVNVDEAVRWNSAVRNRPLVAGESRLDADGLAVEDLADLVIGCSPWLPGA